MTDHHCLYRFFNADGELLYVGITCNPGGRWPKHMRSKPWWTQVAKIELKTYPGRAAVLAAEKIAIGQERPRYNVVGNRSPGPTKPKSAFPVGSVVAVALRSPSLPLVGVIEKSNKTKAWLRHVDWMIGFFTGELCEFNYSDVECFIRATEVDEAAKLADGFSRHQKVYDLDPLSEFQSKWDRRPGHA